MVFTHINVPVLHKYMPSCVLTAVYYRDLHGNIRWVRSVICWRTFLMPRFSGAGLTCAAAPRTCPREKHKSGASSPPTSAHVATRAKTSLPNECRLGFSFQQACYWGLSRRRLKVLSGPQQNVVLSEERLGPWALPTASEMSQQKLCESVLGTYPAGAGEVHESERAQLPLSKLAFRHAPAGMYGPHR